MQLAGQPLQRMTLLGNAQRARGALGSEQQRSWNYRLASTTSPECVQRSSQSRLRCTGDLTSGSSGSDLGLPSDDCTRRGQRASQSLCWNAGFWAGASSVQEGQLQDLLSQEQGASGGWFLQPSATSYLR